MRNPKRISKHTGLVSFLRYISALHPPMCGPGEFQKVGYHEKTAP